MILISDLEVEWTRRGIRREKMILFNEPIQLSHGGLTQLERLADDGIKFTLVSEGENNLDSRYQIILDRADLEKMQKFLMETI